MVSGIRFFDESPYLRFADVFAQGSCRMRPTLQKQKANPEWAFPMHINLYTDELLPLALWQWWCYACWFTSFGGWTWCRRYDKRKVISQPMTEIYHCWYIFGDLLFHVYADPEIRSLNYEGTSYFRSRVEAISQSPEGVLCGCFAAIKCAVMAVIAAISAYL